MSHKRRDLYFRATYHTTGIFVSFFLSFSFSASLRLAAALVNVIANSTARYYRCARDSVALRAGYSDDTRLAARTDKYRLSIPRFRLIALNEISLADAQAPRGHAYTCPQPYAYARTRVLVVKDFIVMNLIFIQTVLAVLPRTLFLPFSLCIPLSLSFPLPSLLSLAPSFSSSPSSTTGNTRRTERYVPMQTWFAGYLEWNKGGELSSTAPYPGWLSVIQ